MTFFNNIAKKKKKKSAAGRDQHWKNASWKVNASESDELVKKEEGTSGYQEGSQQPTREKRWKFVCRILKPIVSIQPSG